MDTVVTILDGAGNALATNDDHAGACSLASVASLAPGAYYARIEAPAGASPAAATFPYQLHAGTFKCGDGTVAVGEECDDGNVANGDGCSAACKVEVNESEPNGTIALADAYSSPWVARIDPDGDVDVVKVTVPSAGAKLTATTSDPKGGAGCLSVIDTYVEILDANGAVLALNDDANGGYCSSATANNLAAGTYYVRVQAPPLLGAANVFIYSYKLAVQIQ
jgi:cysteine-rich repeat protein